MCSFVCSPFRLERESGLGVRYKSRMWNGNLVFCGFTRAHSTMKTKETAHIGKCEGKYFGTKIRGKKDGERDEDEYRFVVNASFLSN